MVTDHTTQIGCRSVFVRSLIVFAIRVDMLRARMGLPTLHQSHYSRLKLSGRRRRGSNFGRFRQMFRPRPRESDESQ
jgi:hypothetical protein